MSQAPRPLTDPLDIKLNVERLVFFSDAVMAIAITLLALNLRVPDIPSELAAQELPGRLLQMLPAFATFALSFVVIGIFWASHYRIFGYIRRYDAILVWLNLFFLIFVAFMPFATSLMGAFGFVPLASVIYALCAGGLGLSLTLLWAYASSNHRLVDPEMSPTLGHALLMRQLGATLVFAASIPLAFVATTAAQAIWWGALLVGPLLSRWVMQRERPKQTATGQE